MEFNFSTCFVCQKRVVKSRDILATRDSLSKIKVAVEQKVRFGDKNIILQKLFSDCEINDILAKNLLIIDRVTQNLQTKQT